MGELSIAELEDELKTMKAQKDIDGEFQTLRRLGSALQKNRQFTKAASCFSRALNLVKDNPNAGDQALVHASLGCVYWEMAQLKKAMTHFQSALEIQQQFQDAPGQAGLLTLIGISCWRKCQWEEGLAYFSKVRELRQIRPPATANTPEDGEYSFIAEAIERAVATLQNRVRLGREQGDALKILQPLFAMIPLYLFTARKNEIEPLLQEVTPLAEQLQKIDIQNAVPRLQALIARW
jgi:tetratricopeptide (TPR) repeat protein